MDMQSQSRAIDKVYKRRERYEIPEWQREEVWSEDTQRKLIDTILRGWHLPKFYFLASETEDGYFEVVDGQQRLSAIWAFIDGDLTLDKGSASKHGGDTYASLPDKIQDDFDDYELQYGLNTQKCGLLWANLQFGSNVRCSCNL